MRVFHVIDSLSPDGGGPPLMVLRLTAMQAREAAPMIIAHQNPEQRDRIDRFIADHGDPEHVAIHRFDVRSPHDRLGANDAIRTLSERLQPADVVHLHGFWSPLGLQAARVARRVGAPYVVRPAGMLEPWSLSQKRLKKQIALRLGFKAMLNRAAALHATAPSEGEQFRRLGLRPPVAVIPNGIDLEPYNVVPNPSVLTAEWPEMSGKRLLLFLSRIHPKKGLPMLLRVWAGLQETFPQWHLVIAGPDEGGHLAEIQAVIDEQAISDRVTITGPVFGETKAQLIVNSDLFVLPTHSENFGVVVAEALAGGVPVLTTHGTPWQSLEQRGCGWWIPVHEKELHASLRKALACSPDQLAEMGEKGRAFVREAFTIQAMASKTVALYRWLQGDGPQPDNVFLDAITAT